MHQHQLACKNAHDVFNRQFSTAKKSADDLADVQLLVYTVYTMYTQKIRTVYTVYTVCTHMPNVYNFEADTVVYRTAVPHECTMHGGNRHPDLDLE
jgi:hypothetical protein